MTGTRVAVLGLGRMGGPIADHIIAAGHEVTVYDVDPAAMAPRIEAGATTASSAADAASHAQFVHVVVFDDEQVLAVMTGSKGALSTLERGPSCVSTPPCRWTPSVTSPPGRQRKASRCWTLASAEVSPGPQPARCSPWWAVRSMRSNG